MFRHILLATDLSETSEPALDVAAGLAHAHRSRLTVLYVYSVAGAPLPEDAQALAAATWPGCVRARARVELLVERFRTLGVIAGAAVRVGAIADEVPAEALVRGADLIVAGTRRRSGFARIWYGSVAEQIVRRSPVPVLTVPAARGNVLRFRRSDPIRPSTAAKRREELS